MDIILYLMLVALICFVGYRFDVQIDDRFNRLEKLIKEQDKHD